MERSVNDSRPSLRCFKMVLEPRVAKNYINTPLGLHPQEGLSLDENSFIRKEGMRE